MRVLVVDDSNAVRARLVAMLAEVSRVERVLQAIDAASAMIAVEKDAPHIVVLDLQLRHENGISLLGQIKQRVESPLVIVLTNHADEQHRRECLRAGADRFFDKSRDFDRVVEVVLAHALERGPRGVVPRP